MSLNIQSNINQGLSLISLLGSQTPMAAKQREKAAYQAKVEKFSADVAAAEAASEEAIAAYDVPKAGTEEEKAAGELYGKALEEEVKARERLFEIHPTREGALSLAKTRSAVTGYRETQAEEIERQAREALEKEQKRISESNRIAAILEGTPAHTTQLITEARKNVKK